MCLNDFETKLARSTQERPEINSSSYMIKLMILHKIKIKIMSEAVVPELEMSSDSKTLIT